jgi:hypothetical protein
MDRNRVDRLLAELTREMCLPGGGEVSREHLKLGLRAHSTMPYNPEGSLGWRIGWVIGAHNWLVAAERRGKPVPNKSGGGRKGMIQ